MQSIWSGTIDSHWAGDFPKSFMSASKAGSAAIKNIDSTSVSTQWPSSELPNLYVSTSVTDVCTSVSVLSQGREVDVLRLFAWCYWFDLVL